jgi:hypothetical protein
MPGAEWLGLAEGFEILIMFARGRGAPGHSPVLPTNAYIPF